MVSHAPSWQSKPGVRLRLSAATPPVKFSAGQIVGYLRAPAGCTSIRLCYYHSRRKIVHDAGSSYWKGIIRALDDAGPSTALLLQCRNAPCGAAAACSLLRNLSLCSWATLSRDPSSAYYSFSSLPLIDFKVRPIQKPDTQLTTPCGRSDFALLLMNAPSSVSVHQSELVRLSDIDRHMYSRPFPPPHQFSVLRRHHRSPPATGTHPLSSLEPA